MNPADLTDKEKDAIRYVLLARASFLWNQSDLQYEDYEQSERMRKDADWHSRLADRFK